MRTKNALKNIFMSIFSQIVIILLGFLSRKVFLNSLGEEYLGINGLISNILSIIILVESGIGISIVYNLYKPLAENNTEKIISLVQLYKKAYGVLAIIILMMSLILYPFLGKIIKGSEAISNLTLVYFIFVSKNIVSYFNAHKWALINADQKGYVLARTNLIFQMLSTILKIVILMMTQNYILYLVIELIVYVCQNIFNTYVVNKRYPYIKTSKKYPLDDESKSDIKSKVKAMFMHNIGGYCVFGTDNILISAFVNIGTVGLYSNYTMIIDQLGALLSPIVGGVGASVGNLIATEGPEKNYSVFKTMYLVNFWVYSWCVVFLYNLLEPFIDWWLGDGYLLGKGTFIVILINFYICGLRKSTETFKDKAGLFEPDKYASIIEAIINLTVSIVLVKKIGLVGIFIGTTISTMSVVFWTHPYIAYKYIFKKPVISYYKKYIGFVVITLITSYITTSVCNFLVVGSGFISLVCKGIICVLLPNVIYFALFYKTDELQYLLNILKSNIPALNKIKVKNITS